MSSMNFLDKLLAGVDVKWKALGELTLPTSNIKWRDANRTYRYIDLTSVSIETKAIIETSEIASSNAPSRAQKLIEKNDVIFATTRPTQQRYCLIDENYDGEVASTGYCVLRAKQDVVQPKWIMYWIASTDFKIYAEENQSGSAYPAISDAKVKDFKIPIPCPENPRKSLETQAEIVRILDVFTELTAELTAELSMRKKQYNHYRDRLLSFEDGEVEWKTLGQVFEFKNGINKEKEFFGRGDNIINYTDVFKNNKLFENSFNGKVVTNKSDIERFNCKKGDVFFTRTSETQDEIGYAAVLLSDIHVCVFSGFLIRARPLTNLLLPEYCAYCFSSKDIRKAIISSSNMTTRVTTTGTALSKIKIPIPPLAEQARIVAILDKFHALTNSISEGLPREIELRQQQYEYYRDLLLSFPKPEEIAA